MVAVGHPPAVFLGLGKACNNSFFGVSIASYFGDG